MLPSRTDTMIRLVIFKNLTLVNNQIASRHINKLSIRSLNTAIESKKIESDGMGIKKSVFISQSNNIFKNLAVEDWIFKNMDLKKQQVMMLWRNNPCVVIGKFQNPWQEANINFLKNQNIPLARRNSGGGCVYHDLGNLNVSIFTSRERYDRSHNLGILKRALFRAYGIKAEINKRLDITVDQLHKISGTASKIGRDKAYHHCTLLVNTNKENLKKALSQKLVGLETNATKSVPSQVANLCDVTNNIDMDQLITTIGTEFLRTLPDLKDGGEEYISCHNGFQMINPTEEWFPGLNETCEELQSWEWCYGKTPAFTVSRNFLVPDELLTKSNNQCSLQELMIKMTVVNGVINDLMLVIPPRMMDSGFLGKAPVITQLKGKKFTSESILALEAAMLDTQSTCHPTNKLGDREYFVAKCFNKVINMV